MSGVSLQVAKLLLLFLLPVAWSNNRQPPNVSKLKTDQRKLRGVELRSGLKQQQLPTTQRFNPKFGDAKTTEKHGSQTSALMAQRVEYLAQGDLPIFFLFVRRRKTGPWSRFDLRKGDESIRLTCENVVQNGGVEAEGLREDVDRYMVSRLFGLAGETAIPPLLVNKIKTSLPQLKKLRPRDLEIGYKLAADGEEISSLTALQQLERERLRRQAVLQHGQAELTQLSLLDEIHESESRIEARPVSEGSAYFPPLAPAPKLDLGQYLASVRAADGTSSAPFSPAVAVLLGQLEDFVSRCPDSDFSLYLCSDGSATMCQGGCSSASAGIFATTLADGQLVEDVNEKRLPTDNVDREEQDEEDRPKTSACAFRVHISQVEGVVESPFDSELVAGLAAVSMAVRIIAALNSSFRRPRVPDNVVILTDSKTLLRAARTGPDGNEELVRRGGEQRRLLWALLMDKLAQFEDLGIPCSFQWTAGHPERKGELRDSWTFEDWAIWEADNLARAPQEAADQQCASIELTELLTIIN